MVISPKRVEGVRCTALGGDNIFVYVCKVRTTGTGQSEKTLVRAAWILFSHQRVALQARNTGQGLRRHAFPEKIDQKSGIVKNFLQKTRG
jgi:hypothetical protein